MDPFGFSDTLLRLVKALKNAPAEAAELRDELYGLVGVLISVEQELDSVVGDSQYRETLVHILTSLRKKILVLTDRISRVQRQGTLKNLQWPFTREQTREFISSIERYKSTLTLLLNIRQSQRNELAISLADTILRRLGQLPEVVAADNTEASLKKSDENVKKYLALLSDDTITIPESVEESKSDRYVDWIGHFIERLCPLDLLQNQEKIYHSQLERRMKGTTAWIFTDQLYQQWFRQKGSILWLRGQAGSGKTVLMSSVIESLGGFSREPSKTWTAMGCFYCSHLRNEHPCLILGCILAQLLLQLPNDNPNSAHVLLEDTCRNYLNNSEQRSAIDESTLLFFFHLLSNCFVDAYIVVDGLDESENRASLVSLLLAITNNAIHTCVSSRPSADLEKELSLYPTIDSESSRVEEDIACYVRSQLDVLVGDLGQGHDIINTVVSNSRSSFLIAHHQVHELNLRQSRNQVEEALKSFSDLIRPGACLQRIENVDTKVDHEIIRQALVWLTYSTRPLDLLELTIALNPELWHSIRDSSESETVQSKMKLLTEIRDAIVESNGGRVPELELVNSKTLPDGSSNPYFADASERDRILLETCLSYMSSVSTPLADGPVLMQSDLDRRLENNPFLSYAAYYWMTHYCPEFSPRVTSFLGSNNMIYLAWSQLYDAREYPPAYQEIETENPPDEIKLQNPKSFPSGLYYAALFGMTEVVNLLLEKNYDVDVNRAGGYYRFPLHAAARGGHKEVINSLLRRGANRELLDQHGRTAMEVAALYGHTTVAAILSPGRMVIDRMQANDHEANCEIKLWRSLVDKYPKDEEILDHLDRAYLKKSDMELTVAGWKDVVLNHPNSKVAIRKLREAYVMNNNCDAAISGWWQLYEANMPHTSILKELRDSFEWKYHSHVKRSLLQFFFYCLLVLVARKLIEWGAERVDWSPFATEEEIQRLLPYTMQHVNTEDTKLETERPFGGLHVNAQTKTAPIAKQQKVVKL